MKTTIQIEVNEDNLIKDLNAAGKLAAINFIQKLELSFAEVDFSLELIETLIRSVAKEDPEIELDIRAIIDKVYSK